MKHALIVSAFLALAACKEEATLPEPILMTDEALGHYCQMYLADHGGPKAQVFMNGYDQPYWFSQVSDAAEFRADPEKPAPISVIYVSDMAMAESWDYPGEGNWIEAGLAHYVIHGDRVGGMGLPEAVPFSTMEAAMAYADEHGGRVVGWDEVPADYARMAMKGDKVAAPHMSGHAIHGEASE
jgi:copper chaperone NosL